MDQRHSDTITIPLLPIVALLALGFTLILPALPAHAAPQRPLGTGCTNPYYISGWSFVTVYNNFYSDQEFFCNHNSGTLYQEDITYFALGSGNVNSLDAQGDTWMAQVNHYCGAGCPIRYGETGRSSRVSYPANGKYYFVQNALITNEFFSPMWGCNWINWYTYGSTDYDCGDLE